MHLKAQLCVVSRADPRDLPRLLPQPYVQQVGLIVSHAIKLTASSLIMSEVPMGSMQESGMHESPQRALVSAVFTLTLSILGRCDHASPPPPLSRALSVPISTLRTAVSAGLTASTWSRSSILPVPFAFARTGVLLGLCTMLVVGLCNTYTSTLMLRAAALTGHDSYEGVAYAVGGRAWKARMPLCAPVHIRCNAAARRLGSQL